MFHEKLTSYLKNRGLETSDIPIVLRDFYIVKQTTLACVILLSIKWQPLTRLFAQAQTRTGKSFDSHVLTQATKTTNSPPQSAYKSTIARMGKAKLDYQSGRLATNKNNFGNKFSYFERFGSFYTRQADKLTGQVNKSDYFKRLATFTNQEPRKLAVGVVEGLLLYKFTFPITAPLSLYFVVKLRRLWYEKKVHKEEEELDLMMQCSDLLDEGEIIEGKKDE